MRHPWDRGSPLLRWAIGVLVLTQNRRCWRRHPAPFAKSRRGMARRRDRRFVRSFEMSFEMES